MKKRETPRSDRQIFVPDAETEVREELDFHLAMRAREYVARGMSPVEAREAALRRFGNLDSLGTQCRRLAEERDRTMKRAEITTELLHDVRYAVRQLRRAPGFTMAAVLTLALGVGATAAMFGAVDAVLLRPLPLPAADRLVVPESQNLKDGERWSVTYADYEDWRAAGVFEHVAVYSRGNVNVAGETDAERVPLASVSEDFFAVLRLAPALGTTFGPNEFTVGTPRRIVLSHGLWQRRFGGDPAVVGTTIRVGGRPAEVAGVLPEGQSYPAGIDVWVPLQLDADDLQNVRRRDNFIFEAIARLAPGKTFEQTQTELSGLARRVAAAEPVTRGEVTVNISPVTRYIVGERVTRTLWILFGAVAMVLLIGCVNVANLLLGRSATRARELAIRTGLGATRGRLARQLVTESVVLSLLAGAAGVLLAIVAVRALVAAAPPNVPRLDAIGIDAKVLGFAFAASLFCALLFGVLPALRASREAVADALASGSVRTTWGARARRRRGVLVVAEIALALMLLIGASLLLRSFSNLRGTDPGFETERLLTFSLSLQGERYADLSVRPGAYAQLGSRLAALAGVRDVAFASSLPLGGGGFYLGRSFLFEGQAEPPASEAVSGMWITVTPNYFATMEIPLRQGRDFTDRDNASAVPVMIVNREFVRQMFGEQNPLGRRVRSWRDENVYREIVGVADDVRFFGASDEIRPLVYVPYAQDSWNSMAAVVRTNVPPATLADATRRVVREFDPTLGTASMRSFDEVFADSVAASRFTAYLLGILASVALALALIGVYGVLSYDITQRTREIGIRMALGARRGAVVGLVLRDAGVVVILGIALGVAGAWGLARFVRALLFEVSPTDPLTFALGAVLVLAVAFAASMVPGRRAAAVDPVRALRAE